MAAQTHADVLYEKLSRAIIFVTTDQGTESVSANWMGESVMSVLQQYQKQHGLNVDASLPLPPAPNRPGKDERVFGGMAGVIGGCNIIDKAQSEMCSSMP